MKILNEDELFKINRFLQLLNEDENVVEDINSKLEEIFAKVKDFYSLDSVDKFKSAYLEWTKSINEVYEKIKSLNNEEVNKKLEEFKDADPFKLACICEEATNKLNS